MLYQCTKGAHRKLFVLWNGKVHAYSGLCHYKVTANLAQ